MTQKIFTAYQCNSCQEIFLNESHEPLYECSNCGRVFIKSNSYNTKTPNQCPDCQAFGIRKSGNACPECEMGELEEINAYQCNICHKLISDHDDDYPTHLLSEHKDFLVNFYLESQKTAAVNEETGCFLKATSKPTLKRWRRKYIRRIVAEGL